MRFPFHLWRPVAVIGALVLVVGVARVIAAPPGSVYTPGETLAPTCSPGDSNCTVTAPMVAVTPGSDGNVLTSNGSAWVSEAPASSGGASSYTATISGPSSTITPGGSLILLDNTTGESVLLTSTPTITAGTDGQQIILMNLGSSPVELQDDSTLPGSLLRFPATSTFSLAIGDSLPLIYVASVGRWYSFADRANY